MKFDWDPEKASRNLRKHKVPFELASTVFDDPFHLSIPDPDHRDEERWITVGVAVSTQLLVVVHTERWMENDLEVIRIISARRATKKERNEYEEGI